MFIAGGVKFWMGLNDLATEGSYIWDGTRKNLYPWAGGIGYANWDRGEPNGNASNDEDCGEIYLSKVFITAWNDKSCANLIGAICERQP